MDKQSFFSLLDKYQDGTASASEKVLIEAYYHRLEKAGITELSAEEEAALKEAMYKQITASMGKPEATVISIKRKNYRLAAAAVLPRRQQQHEPGGGRRSSTRSCRRRDGGSRRTPRP